MPEKGIVDKDLVAPTAAVEAFVASTSTNPSSKLSDPKFSRFECSDDDDSEDDVPLSELTRASSDDPHVSLKRARAPSPHEDPIFSKRRTASCCIKMLFFFDD